MEHPLLRLGLVGSILVLGCTQGHCPWTSGPLAVSVGRPSGETASSASSPQVKILEVVPAAGAVEEEESGEEPLASPSPQPLPAVVGAAREEVSCGHAPDYRWLIGELHYSPARGVWSLRYATAEEEDAHGGSVTLVGAGAMSGLQVGARVRIEGEMLDPETREPSPPYQVRSLGRLLEQRAQGSGVSGAQPLTPLPCVRGSDGTRRRG
jgi:hypothetical protein